MLLALDIGGTKVAAATFDLRSGDLVMGEVSRYPTADFTGLEDLLQRHMAGQGTSELTGVGIGVAGPVLGRQVKLTNLPWVVDADSLEARFGAPVHLLNDLEAHGYAVPHAAAQHLVTLQAGRPRIGNRALIAAGTGLGEAILFRHAGGFHVSSSEGGHTTFAPSNAAEIELLSFLQTRYEHVSWERVVSGLDGFRNLYDFLLATQRIDVAATQREALHGRADVGALIIEEAQAGREYARTVLTWFARLYGSEAGNLALKAMAVEGVCIAGGIAPRILPYLQKDFVPAFTAKGRFGSVLEGVPVHVLTDPNAALKGAAHFLHSRISRSYL